MLNPQQQEAVAYTQGPLLVLAGAGSGKTRVLTHRIAHLLAQGVSPYNILAVTFTNKAAEEMRDRVQQLVGEAAQHLWINTFHSVCLRMLRRDIAALGIQQSFNIYDVDDQKNVIKSIIKDMGLELKEHPAKNYISYIDESKNTSRSHEEILEYIEAEYGRTAQEIYRRYQQTLDAAQALDFNDLLRKTIEVWTKHPAILWRRQQQFQYLMVDEYQDTNPAQYELLRLLAKRLRNIMVVGDDDQSIYGFRGADVQNIVRFQEEFTPVKIIRLEQNYRSFGHILQAANAVISNNRQRMAKKMWTKAKLGPKLGWIQTANQWDTARAILNQIVSMIRMGRKYGDFAIIYRTNAASLPFEQELVRNSIPHVLVGSRKFYDRKEIRDVMSYLRLLSNPADDIAFMRAIAIPRRGIGAKSLAKIQLFARTHSLSMLQACTRWPAKGKTKKSLADFSALISELREQAVKQIAPAQLCQFIMERSGYQQALQQDVAKERQRSGFQKTDAERRLENIEALQNDLARCWEEYVPTEDDGDQEPLSWIHDFLDRAALRSPTEDLPQEEQQAVTLLTAHLAKGLEFPVVFVVGLSEGNFPHFRSLDREEDIEEERRLLYVAMTRAREKLFLSRSEKQQRREAATVRWVPVEVSRFVQEIPADLFMESSPKQSFQRKNPPKWKKTIVQSTVPQRPLFTPKNDEVVRTMIPDSYSVFKAGVVVSHPQFGRGIIRSTSGQSHNPKLRVEFERGTIRTLIAKYANLEVVIL